MEATEIAPERYVIVEHADLDMEGDKRLDDWFVQRRCPSWWGWVLQATTPYTVLCTW